MFGFFAKLMLAMVLLVPTAQAGTMLSITITGNTDVARVQADARLARHVATALAADVRLKGTALRVDIDGGVAVIAGRVFNDQERQLALGVAREALGGAEVVSRIVTLEDFMPTTLARGGDRVAVGL